MAHATIADQGLAARAKDAAIAQDQHPASVASVLCSGLSKDFTMNLISRLVRVCCLAIPALAIGLTGCHPAAPVQPAVVMPAVTPDRHDVRGEQLRRIMGQIELLMQDRVQADLALDASRIDEADKLAAAAAALADAAPSISAAATTSTLDDSGRQRFDAYARELERGAEALEDYASRREFMQSAAQFERLGHACAGCHSLYRAR